MDVKVITICGSIRYSREMIKIAEELEQFTIENLSKCSTYWDFCKKNKNY